MQNVYLCSNSKKTSIAKIFVFFKHATHHRYFTSTTVFLSLEDTISPNGQVRFIDAFVEYVDRSKLNFALKNAQDQNLHSSKTSKCIVSASARFSQKNVSGFFIVREQSRTQQSLAVSASTISRNNVCVKFDFIIDKPVIYVHHQFFLTKIQHTCVSMVLAFLCKRIS
jgi:hypothetical protein